MGYPFTPRVCSLLILATFADPPGPDDAVKLLARLPLQAIIYAWTVGSYLLGTTGEEELAITPMARRAFPPMKTACAEDGTCLRTHS
jgi:hypothetical protein